jgi:ABC-type transporter Mla MlaB component
VIGVNNTIVEIKNGMLWVEGRIHFDNVVSMCRKGIELMKTLENIKVNLQGLSQSDSSMLALLTAWVRESHEQKKAIVFIHMPIFMNDITKVCGLDGVLPISWEN